MDGDAARHAEDADELDLVIVGSGSAAQAVAYPCAEAGWRVAVVDSRPFGGTCALRGCDPKKVLVTATGVIEAARRLEGRGVPRLDGALDWGELVRFERSFTEPVPGSTEASLREAGI